ncbi:MAG TPA: Fis family transcriptional regulator [Holosporales bacterium]|nr:Fis family transcriptional regulator [Holosporales bacterium]
MGQENNNLSKLITTCLQEYFKSLKGQKPASNLYDNIIQTVERPLIREILKLTKNNQRKAADILGMNRNTLRKKIIALELNDVNDSDTIHPLQKVS